MKKQTKGEVHIVGDQTIKKIMTFLVVPVMMMVGESVGAQQADQAPKRKVIDFEDELVEGQAQKPELFYLLQQRQFNFQRLIRLRENFIPEMERTSEDIQRRGR